MDLSSSTITSSSSGSNKDIGGNFNKIDEGKSFSIVYMNNEEDKHFGNIV
jgi:hypothetical protein